IRRYITFLQEYSIPLILGVIVALVWANIDFDSYHHLVEFDFWNIGKGPFLDDDEVFMVFFFGIAAKEITESILPGGALNPIPKAINPLMGTLGGVFGPVGLFLLMAVLFYAEGVLGGWAIPTATDIALAWLVARVIFGARHAAVNFLLLLAVADDAIGLVIIAVFYSDNVQPLWLLMTLGGMVAAYAFRRIGITWWPVYIFIAGGMSWVGLVLAGVEPALALVVIVPFLPALHAPAQHAASSHGHAMGTLEKFEHHLKLPVDFGLFFFAWANAGVAFGNINSVTFMILISLIVGKTVGVSLFSFVVSRLGFPLPEGMSLRHLMVAGLIAGLGLTVALFVANKAYYGTDFLDPGKMGAVFSVVVAALAFALARVLGIRREQD
ncbi:Na(+)/H(+) antiporter NhaA, partial [Geodia barretti]